MVCLWRNKVSMQLIVSAYSGIVTPYGDKGLSQYWLLAWRHQAITLTDVDQATGRPRSIDPMAPQ